MNARMLPVYGGAILLILVLAPAYAQTTDLIALAGNGTFQDVQAAIRVSYGE